MWLANYVDVSRAIWSPTGMAQIAQTMHGFQRYWKMANTVGRPLTFNARNLVGAILNNMLIGVSPADPLYLVLAPITHRWRHTLNKTGSIERALETVPLRYREAFREMYEHSGGLSGYKINNLSPGANAVHPLTTTAGRRQAVNPLSSGFGLFRAGAAMMGSVEDLVRSVAFVKHFRAGMDAETAASLVVGVHFDYADLTNMERRMQQYIPFWVWSKRNLQLQVRAVLERPEVAMRYYKLQKAYADNFGSTEEDYDGFSPQRYWGPYAAPTSSFIRKDTPYWARLFFDLDAPIKDLMTSPLANPTSPSEWINWVSGMLGPRSQLLEIATNPDPGYTQIAPIGLSQALLIASVLPGFDWRASPDGRVPINPLLGEAFDSIFPWVRNLVEPLLVPNDPRRAQRLGFSPDDQGASDRLRAFLLEQGKGLGVRVQTPLEQAGASFDIDERTRAALERLKIEDRKSVV